MSRPLSALLAVLLLASACSRQESATSAGSAESAADVAAIAPAPSSTSASVPMRAQAGAVARAGEVADAQVGSAALTQESGSRRFIRTVFADFQVADVHRAARRIEDLAASHGGFVARSDIDSEIRSVQRRPLGDGRLVELSVYVLNVQMQVRVPSARAQGFMRTLAAEMEFLDRRRYQAVEAQFELLRQQLARARADQAQREFAQAARAGGRGGEKVHAIEAVTAQRLARDEALLAQRSFEDQVEFASIDLSMHQPERVRRSERPDVEAILDREGPGFLQRAARALQAGWRALLEGLVLAIALWPLWLMVGVAVAGFGYWRRRRRG
jgi:hypothetical protein